MHHRWKWLFALAAVLLAMAGAIPASAGVPDTNLSFYVPQAGPLTTPCEGATGNCGAVPGYTLTVGGGAVGTARRCPNDDGVQVLRNWARLKVVVKASDGSAIVGIPASDICVLFNGGTAVQGFTGVGDDSVIANFQWNQTANCPDVRCVSADAPTDGTGTTYISWLGHNPADPAGQASRDPLRKWGGWAGDIPVMVLGFKLQGRLTTGSALGSYTAHVKSFDMEGGRLAIQGQGETVDLGDYNATSAAFTAYRYRNDFDNNGVVNIADMNFILGHYLHKCNVPTVN
jgi:hypothetical protein